MATRESLFNVDPVSPDDNRTGPRCVSRGCQTSRGGRNDDGHRYRLARRAGRLVRHRSRRAGRALRAHRSPGRTPAPHRRGRGDRLAGRGRECRMGRRPRGRAAERCADRDHRTGARAGGRHAVRADAATRGPSRRRRGQGRRGRRRLHRQPRHLRRRRPARPGSADLQGAPEGPQPDGLHRGPGHVRGTAHDLRRRGDLHAARRGRRRRVPRSRQRRPATSPGGSRVSCGRSARWTSPTG